VVEKIHAFGSAMIERDVWRRRMKHVELRIMTPRQRERVRKHAAARVIDIDGTEHTRQVIHVSLPLRLETIPIARGCKQRSR
jgi:hypothetical protein